METILNTVDLKQNKNNQFDLDGTRVELYHQDKDPDNVNRIIISKEQFKVELLPSKGLSIGEAFSKNRPVFWRNPSPLYNPRSLKIYSDEICINNEPAPGFIYIKTYTGGIELLGLDNWGMPAKNNNGDLMILHGAASLIPIENVSINDEKDKVIISGKFVYRSFPKKPSSNKWYEEGAPLFEVEKIVSFDKNIHKIEIKDIFTNISGKSLTPDWGYHITFYPEKDAEYLVPGKKLMERFDGTIRADYEKWKPSPQDKIRIEEGIIFQDLMKEENNSFVGSECISSILKYKDGSGILCQVPPVPYYQTWFCAGGALTDEFTYKDGAPVLKKNWDGQGIEIGSSALDHNGKTDPTVAKEKELMPGESKTVQIHVTLLDKENLEKHENKITSYNQDRTIA
jgi:hypothetical protein